jgi:hypothetical protein
MVAGNEMQVSEGGGAIMFAGQARLTGSRVGLLIARTPVMDPNSQVGLNVGTPQAVAAGAALGLAFAALSYLLRRR